MSEEKSNKPKYKFSTKRAIKKILKQATGSDYSVLANNLPDLDPDVAVEVVAQAPNFKDIAIGILNAYGNTLDSLDKSAEDAADAIRHVMDDIRNELETKELTQDERRELLDRECVLAREMIDLRQAVVDDNKDVLNMVLKYVGGTVFAILALLGVKVVPSIKTNTK